MSITVLLMSLKKQEKKSDENIYSGFNILS